MPPSSLLIAVDMESFTALRIEPHLSTATVYLHLHLFGCHIHVHIDHFPRCYQLKSLLEKFRILHAAAFLPYLCKESHAFVLRLADGARNERTADERKRWLPSPARSEACSREKRNKWRGPTQWGGGRL